MTIYEKLDDYQRMAFRKAVRLKSCCIFFEQGVGKTHPSLALAEFLADEDPKFTGLFVVRLTNKETTWLDLAKSLLPHINFSTRWEDFKKSPYPKALLVHYNELKKVKKKITKFKWSLFVADECQDLRSRGTVQSRICGAIKHAEYRLGLSGTPIDEEPMELFGILRAIVPHLYGNDRSAWTRFDERFLKPSGYMGYQRKFKENMLEEFLEEVKPYVLRIEAEDVLDLPNCEKIVEECEMVGEQSRLYYEMEDHFVTDILHERAERKRLREIAKEEGKQFSTEGRVSAGLTITQMVKLQQICNGFITDDDGEFHTFGSTKLRRTKYLLKRKVKLPVVIFYQYSQERVQLEKLCQSLSLSYKSIHGKVKDRKIKKSRTKTIREFQEGKLDILNCQIRTGGVGVDLYRASTAIMFSSTFSWIDFDQANKRIDRRGQTKETKIFFLVVKNSIDEDKYNKILSKRTVNKAIFKTMKVYGLKQMLKRRKKDV